MVDSCVFCAIIDGKIPSYKVYEDENTLAFLDIHPSAPGHTLLIPKAHVAQVEDLPEEDARYLFSTLHLIVGRIQKAMGAPATTIGINNGRESGQEVPHVHIHVIPRTQGDKGSMIQGVSRSPPRLDADEMDRIAHEIREQIKDVRAQT
jgi:histidine triad (HIT) family protein